MYYRNSFIKHYPFNGHRFEKAKPYVEPVYSKSRYVSMAAFYEHLAYVWYERAEPDGGFLRTHSKFSSEWCMNEADGHARTAEDFYAKAHKAQS